MTSALRVVLFDLGGVICRFDPAGRLRAMSSATGLPEAWIREEIWESDFDAACERGEHSARDAHRLFCERLGVSLARQELARLYATAFHPDDSVLAVVDALAPGLTRGLLTNNGALLRESLPQLFPELARRFKPNLFFSCDFGALKPAPGLFRSVLERLSRPPDAALLIDDSPANVAGAEACGLQAIRFTGAAALRRELESRGLLSQQA